MTQEICDLCDGAGAIMVGERTEQKCPKCDGDSVVESGDIHYHDAACESCEMFLQDCKRCGQPRLFHEYECPEAQS